MSIVYLLRHAHAENHSASGLDADRKLSPRGQQQAGSAAQWLARCAQRPVCVVASPAQRTRQTALAAQKALELPDAALHWERAVYEASAGMLVDILNRYWDTTPLVLVGHNPGLETLLRLALQPAAGQLPPGMGTATIAQLAWPANGRILEQSAHLVALFSPG